MVWNSKELVCPVFGTRNVMWRMGVSDKKQAVTIAQDFLRVAVAHNEMDMVCGLSLDLNRLSFGNVWLDKQTTIPQAHAHSRAHKY